VNGVLEIKQCMHECQKRDLCDFDTKPMTSVAPVYKQQETSSRYCVAIHNLCNVRPYCKLLMLQHREGTAQLRFQAFLGWWSTNQAFSPVYTPQNPLVKVVLNAGALRFVMATRAGSQPCIESPLIVEVLLRELMISSLGRVSPLPQQRKRSRAHRQSGPHAIT
jgi:hypothetical protein